MKRVQSFEEAKRKRSRVLRLLRLVLVLFVLYEAFTAFALKTVVVGSLSMSPTLVPGDRVLVASSAYGVYNPLSGRRTSLRTPKRGDIVLMHAPAYSSRPWFIRAADSVIRLVTFQRARFPGMRAVSDNPVLLRVVAGPGDSVRMDSFIVHVKPAGQEHFLTEYEVSGGTYDIVGSGAIEGWTHDMPLSGNFPVTQLGSDELFVVGDNRASTSDSRFFGPISSSNIVGKVLARYWPFDRLSRL